MTTSFIQYKPSLDLGLIFPVGTSKTIHISSICLLIWAELEESFGEKKVYSNDAATNMLNSGYGVKQFF